MSRTRPIGPRLSMALVALATLSASSALAQTDEIQVYDGGLAAPGVVNLTLHDNYTPRGARTPGFPGGIAPNHTLNGVPEFAYGVTPWFEAGLYLPLYTLQPNGRARLDGFKLRALFAAPDADRRDLFYGVNFEFSVNSRHWAEKRTGGEIRPIIGARHGPWTVIANPILDTDYRGVSHMTFAPATRVAYDLSKTWTVAGETYSDFGEIRRFSPRAQQSHQVFAVVDHKAANLDIEAGVGWGLTQASDKLVLKLILSKDL